MEKNIASKVKVLTSLGVAALALTVSFQNCAPSEFSKTGMLSTDSNNANAMGPVLDLPDQNTSGPVDDDTNPTSNESDDTVSEPVAASPNIKPTPASPSPSSSKDEDKTCPNKGSGSEGASSEDSSRNSKCADIKILGTTLAIDHIEIAPSSEEHGKSNKGSPLASSSGNTISVGSAIKVRDLRVILKESGSSLQTESGSIALKTPSAMTSGLKVRLLNEIELVPGKTYRLIIPSEGMRLMLNGNKCMLNPVVTGAILE